MATKFDTSFIPKEEADTGQQRSQRTQGSSSAIYSVIFVVTLVGFLGSAAAGVGVFLYGTYLEQTIASKEASLDRARGAFNPDLIEQLSRTSVRLSAADSLLDQHVALSAVFRELERITLKPIQFSEFEYQNEGSILQLEMQGEASSFADVALQSQRFTDSPLFQNPVFADLSVNDNDRVSFSVSTEVPSEEVHYDQYLDLYRDDASATSTTS